MPVKSKLALLDFFSFKIKILLFLISLFSKIKSKLLDNDSSRNLLNLKLKLISKISSIFSGITPEICLKIFLLISKFCSALKRLVEARANEASAFCKSYSVADPKLKRVLVSSKA